MLSISFGMVLIAADGVIHRDETFAGCYGNNAGLCNILRLGLYDAFYRKECLKAESVN